MEKNCRWFVLLVSFIVAYSLISLVLWLFHAEPIWLRALLAACLISIFVGLLGERFIRYLRQTVAVCPDTRFTEANPSVMNHPEQVAEAVSGACHHLAKQMEPSTYPASLAAEPNDEQQCLTDGRLAIRYLCSSLQRATEEIQQLSAQTNNVQQFCQSVTPLAQETERLSQRLFREMLACEKPERQLAPMLEHLNHMSTLMAQELSRIEAMLMDVSLHSAKQAQGMAPLLSQAATVETCVEQLAKRLSGLSTSVEQALVALSELAASPPPNNKYEFVFKTQETQQRDIFDPRILNHARAAAIACGAVLEQGLVEGVFTKQQLFQPEYQLIANSDPAKFSTAFDDYTDQHFPSVQDPILHALPNIVYAGAVDRNGYFPTHNRRYSQPLSGDYQRDVENNRTKRMFDDPIGLRSATSLENMLLQTYKRDTGEVMHDLSVPIWVEGQHWGAFRIGFKRG